MNKLMRFLLVPFIFMVSLQAATMQDFEHYLGLYVEKQYPAYYAELMSILANLSATDSQLATQTLLDMGISIRSESEGGTSAGSQNMYSNVDKRITYIGDLHGDLYSAPLRASSSSNSSREVLLSNQKADTSNNIEQLKFYADQILRTLLENNVENGIIYILNEISQMGLTQDDYAIMTNIINEKATADHRKILADRDLRAIILGHATHNPAIKSILSTMLPELMMVSQPQLTISPNPDFGMYGKQELLAGINPGSSDRTAELEHKGKRKTQRTKKATTAQSETILEQQNVEDLIQRLAIALDCQDFENVINIHAEIEKVWQAAPPDDAAAIQAALESINTPEREQMMQSCQNMLNARRNVSSTSQHNLSAASLANLNASTNNYAPSCWLIEEDENGVMDVGLTRFYELFAQFERTPNYNTASAVLAAFYLLTSRDQVNQIAKIHRVINSLKATMEQVSPETYAQVEVRLKNMLQERRSKLRTQLEEVTHERDNLKEELQQRKRSLAIQVHNELQNTQEKAETFANKHKRNKSC